MNLGAQHMHVLAKDINPNYSLEILKLLDEIKNELRSLNENIVKLQKSDC